MDNPLDIEVSIWVPYMYVNLEINPDIHGLTWVT